MLYVNAFDISWTFQFRGEQFKVQYVGWDQCDGHWPMVDGQLQQRRCWSSAYPSYVANMGYGVVMHRDWCVDFLFTSLFIFIILIILIIYLLILIYFTSWLIYLFLPESTHSVSSPEVVGGNQTWL